MCSTEAVEVQIDGEVDGPLADNIRAHLTVFSAPADCEISATYLKLINDAVSEASQALGYYQTQLQSLTLEDDNECQSILLTVQAGTPVTVESRNIKLSGDGQQDSVLSALIDGFPLKQGDVLNHSAYSAAKRRIQNIALRRGYFDAAFVTQRIEVDTENNKAEVLLQFDSGERYRFGPLILPESLKSRALIEKVRPFESGEFYLADKLAKFNQNLKATGFFQQVVARPRVNLAETYNVPIEVIATSKSRDIINLGGGASTDTGPRARVKWQRPWVTSDGHSLGAELFLSGPQQLLSVDYKIPLEDPLDNYLSFQAGYKRENDNDTESQTYTVSAQRHWGSESSEWNKIGFIRFEEEQFSQGLAPEVTTRLLIPGATLSRHRTRGGLDVSWGDQQQITLETASDSLLSDIDLVRLNIQTKWLRSFDQHRILLRAELGGIATNDFSQVPSSLRYFAGGDQNVRGFGFESLSPKEGEELVGGKFLSFASAEYSYPIAQDWRMAAFLDVGNASDKLFEDLAKGYGLGVSWLSPVGPIRLYLARGHNGDERTFRLHFAMGPAL